MAVHVKAIHRYSSRKLQSNNNIAVRTNFFETNKADTEMWLFKSPRPLTRALSNSPGYPSRPVAKVTISVDPLQSNGDNVDDNSSATELTMELTGSDSENSSSAYSLNMSSHFYPMSVFSESTQDTKFGTGEKERGQEKEKEGEGEEGEWCIGEHHF